MPRKKGSKDYSLEKKLEAIRLWQEEGLSQKEITKKLGIRDPGRVGHGYASTGKKEKQG